MADGSSPALAPIVLREYQARAVEEARGKYRRGAKAVLLVSPTGSGKTIAGSFIASSHLERKGAESMVLVIVPRIELADQWTSTLARVGLRVTADLDTADQISLDGLTPQVIVTTVQALLARKAFPIATLVIADEAHHYVSAEWHKMLAPHIAKGARILGLTATPERADGTGLGELFDALVVVASIKELTDLGYLVPCKVIAPPPPERKKGDRGAIVLAADPADALLEHGKDASGQLRRAIIFCRTIKQARALKDDLASRGVACDSIDSNLRPSVRKDRIAAFRAGSIRVLVNVDILTEGFDDPSVEVIMLARKLGSVGLYLQIIGRGLRPSPDTGKRDCLLVDLGGSKYEHGDPDEERDYSLDGEPISRKKKKPRKCQSCGVVLKHADIRAEKCRTCGEPLGGGIAVIIEPEPLQLTASTPRTHADRPHAYLVKVLREARARGHKDGAAAYRFKERFDRWPSWREKQRAEAEIAQP